jgi:hypothetical protein
MRAYNTLTKPEEADAYLPARKQLESIITHLQSVPRMTLNDLEQFLTDEGREILRRCIQGFLDERGPGAVNEPVIDAKNLEHTHHRLNTRPVTTTFGDVTVSRQGYGGRGLDSLHPLDAELNLSEESYSHQMQREIAGVAAQLSYDEVKATIQKQTGVTVHKRQLEECVRRVSQDFELFYQQQRSATPQQVKASSQILVLMMDQKGVPMRKADLLEATRKAAEKRNPRLQHRRSKGEKPHRKRLSTVAAVYTIPPFLRTPEQIVGEMGPVHEVLPQRPRPEDKRVWASVKQPLGKIVTQAFDEAVRRDPKLAKQWVALVDGDESQLSAMKQAAKDYGVSLVIILDIIHVLEYLWKAAFAIYQEGDPAAESWVKGRLTKILRGESSLVAAGMRRSATRNKLDAKQRVPIDKCANYLLKYAAHLRYDRYLAKGYPIATGVIEGACRYLVKDRMEITGARWSLQGAEDVLRLRSLRASCDFDEYWQFHLRQEYERNHAKKYKKGRVPSPPPAAKGKEKTSSLKLVKQERTAKDDEKDQETRSYDSLETISLKNRGFRRR